MSARCGPGEQRGQPGQLWSDPKIAEPGFGPHPHTTDTDRQNPRLLDQWRIRLERRKKKRPVSESIPLEGSGCRPFRGWRYPAPEFFLRASENGGRAVTAFLFQT